jgi:hypothetical protein
MLEVDRESGGFTACNVYPARPVEPGTLRVFNRGGIRRAIPLGIYIFSKRLPKAPLTRS